MSVFGDEWRERRTMWLMQMWRALRTGSDMAFDQSGPRWLGISDLIAEPEGPTFISYKVARSRLNRLRFVTQDPKRHFQDGSGY
jgi:hypothetical protein